MAIFAGTGYPLTTLFNRNFRLPTLSCMQNNLMIENSQKVSSWELSSSISNNNACMDTVFLYFFSGLRFLHPS